MNKLIVYKNQDRVGIGYLIMLGSGQLMEPVLFTDDGIELQIGEYNLVRTEEECLVVIPTRDQ